MFDFEVYVRGRGDGERVAFPGAGAEPPQALPCGVSAVPLNPAGVSPFPISPHVGSISKSNANIAQSTSALYLLKRDSSKLYRSRQVVMPGHTSGMVLPFILGRVGWEMTRLPWEKDSGETPQGVSTTEEARRFPHRKASYFPPRQPLSSVEDLSVCTLVG